MHDTTTTTTCAPSDAHAAAREALDAYATSARPGRPGWDRPADAGPALLATLVAQAGEGPPPEATAALGAWLADVRTGCSHLGLCNWGLTGVVAGLGAAVRAWPRLEGLLAAFRSDLLSRVARRPWLPAEIGWVDYDLVSGPAGVVLTLSRDPEVVEADVRPACDQLADLCGHDDLAGLRLGQFRFEVYRGWNYGRVNTGVAHGVSGVALALCAAADAWGTRLDSRAALVRIGEWLRTEAHTSPHGVVSWHRGERRGNTLWTPPRGLQNAWCYGNPGTTWALWEVGRVTGDGDLKQYAETAFGTYLQHPKQHDLTRDEGTCMCHGAAGELMVCDAFARYAGLSAAADRRDHLARALTARLDAVAARAGRDATVLSGASGVLAALLTVRGADRAWLAGFGLR